MNTSNRRSREGSVSSRRRTSSNSATASRLPVRGRTQTGRKFHTSNRRSGSVSSRNSSRTFSRGRSHGRNSGRSPRKMPTFDPSRFINTNPVDVKEEVYVPKNTFNTFEINSKLAKTIAEMGITTPTPIQDKIIPEILKGRDVIGLAETGTGKTAAFLIPLIEKTLKDHNRQTLILTPTRELAIQIEEELKKLSRGFRIFSVTCVGGVNIRPQIRALKRLNHFIIGTPGRVLDLIRNHHLPAQNTTTVVLDEADRMLDMGFIGDIKTIVAATPKNRETHFFSATFDARTSGLVKDFLKDPVTVSVKKKDITNSIEQDVVRFDNESVKFETLTDLLDDPEFKRIIIFGAMKHSVKKLAEQLSKGGVSAESIHGNKSHSQRQQSLKKFKSGNARVLVATDVAARGIHVDGVTHVINYDLPGTFEDYVHRIGRTGRAALKGKALTFVQQKNVR